MTVVAEAPEVTERDSRSVAAPGGVAAGAFASKYGLVTLLLAAVVFFSLWGSTRDVFATRANLENLLADQTVKTLLALAFMLPLIGGCFDLSLGATLGLSSLVTAAAMDRFDQPLVVALVLAVGAGVLIGFVNGTIITRVGLDPIIVTLAMSTILTGLMQWYTRGLSIDSRHSDLLISLGSDKVLGVPATTYVLIAFAAATWYVLEHTPFGRGLRALGVNAEAAALVGVNVQASLRRTLAMAGGLAAVGGVVLSARNGAANPADGQSLLFTSIAAIALGATAIRPGQLNVVGAVVAVFFVAVCVSGLSLAGVKPWVQPVFNGVALLVAMTISIVGTRRRAL